jgi:hypothetical protein
VTVVEGFNYSNGDPLHLSLYGPLGEEAPR